ncbi:hypothetical protein Scep_023624 [Stephania cephalantha]|uniref:Uncharacterized protein n=1 Tax=Stephania cephalantha TaxID=152367 RepID=A0AAP0F3Z2_9MAGN
MTTEDAKGPGGGLGQKTTEVLHQRRNLPFSNTTMALTGFAIVLGVGYFVLYAKKKPEATARDVAKVATGVSDPEDTQPRRK